MASMKNCIRPYIEASKKCRKTYHREKYKLTVHVVKSVLKHVEDCLLPPVVLLDLD